jgi:glycosyltransferase involved in cell wall biosynthesis
MQHSSKQSEASPLGMRLLVVAQVIDTEHPILGFFHRWVEEFAKHCEHVHVICLEEGTHSLPANVTVHSLGKEVGKGRVTYLTRFFSLIWTLRHEYDNVFVHMNQIYVILGAPFWRTARKSVGLWYAHGTVSPSLKLATRLTNVVYTSTPEGFRIDTPKRVIVGQGIDTAAFVPVAKSPSETLRLITVGRISESKNLQTLLKACALLKKNGIRFMFTIVGAPITPAEQEYDTAMKKLVVDLGLESTVQFVGAIPNHELPACLQQSDVFIHDGATNSLDKALLEASLCGCIVASANKAYRALTADLAPELLYTQGDFAALSAIITAHNSSHTLSETVRKMIEKRYDISTLVKNIINAYH